MGWAEAPEHKPSAKGWAAAPEIDAAPKEGAEHSGFLDKAVDAVRAIPGGIAQGAAAVLGAPRDMADALDAGVRIVGNKISDGAGDRAVEFGRENAIGGGKLAPPGSKAINDAVSGAVGGYYQPKTVPGEYAQTVSSFAPAALAPGGIAARAARVVAPGVASEAAGQATKGTQLEPVARAVGGLAGGVGAGMAIERMGGKPPSIDDLRKSANALYTKAKNSGVNIKPEAYDGLVDDITATVKEAGTHPKLHPKVDGVLDSLKEVKGQEISLSDLERLRRVANGAAKSIEPDERRVAGLVIDKIDDFMDSLGHTQVRSGDPAVGATLSEARGIWSKMRKSQTIDDLVDDAKTRATAANGNYAAALRGEFQKLVRNDKKMRGFSPDERAAIEKVAKVGATTGTLSALGALRPRGLIGWGELATAVSHPEAAMPMLGAAAGGQASQWLANGLTSRNARLASEMMRASEAGPGATALSPKDLLVSTLLSQGAHH